MNAYDLYNRYTLQELTEMLERMREDPANQQGFSLYLYTPTARKKMEKISWAITWHVRDRKEASNER